MRRRTNAGLTALQAALSGIGGGFAGYAKDTETRKADAERERLQRESERLQREREEERTYGREMGLAGLLQQGFTTPEQFATRRAAAGPDVANYVSQSVRSMMPGSTAAPPDPALMQRVLDTTGGDFREGQRLTIGGRELVLPESTPQRQERLATRERGEARNAAQVAAQQRAKERAEDKQFQLQQDELRRKADMELKLIGVSQTGGSTNASPEPSGAPQKGSTTYSAAADYFGGLTPESVEKLSAKGVYAANVAQTFGGISGGFADVIGTAAGAIKPAEREYLEYAGSVADAWARLSEGARLTNQDINRFRGLTVFQAGDGESDKWRKVQRAQHWASILAGVSASPASESGQSEQNRTNQRTQRGMDSTGAADLTQRETQASGFGLFDVNLNPRGVQQRTYTDEDRANRWDEIREQNPRMTDAQITEQVRREMK